MKYQKRNKQLFKMGCAVRFIRKWNHIKKGTMMRIVNKDQIAGVVLRAMIEPEAGMPMVDHFLQRMKQEPIHISMDDVRAYCEEMTEI